MSSSDANAPEDTDPPLFPRGAMLLPWLVWCLVLPLVAGVGGSIYAEEAKRERRLERQRREAERRERREATRAQREAKQQTLSTARAAYDANEYPEAVELFTAVIAEQPKHVNAHWLRGLSQFELGELAAAQADFARVIELRPKHNGAHRSRAQIRALLGDPEGAIADMTRSADLEPSSAYPPIWIAGLGGGTERLLPFASSTGWISEVARYYVDRLSEEELLERAESAPNARTRKEQLCEAYGYIGLRAERDGDADKAKANYTSCVNTGVTNFIEYRWAAVRLQQDRVPLGGVERD